MEIVLIRRKVRQGGGLSHKDSDGYNKIIRLLTLQYFLVVNTFRSCVSRCFACHNECDRDLDDDVLFGSSVL